MLSVDESLQKSLHSILSEMLIQISLVPFNALTARSGIASGTWFKGTTFFR